MKFNKVEVSAFRIYNDPKNGTFDFTTKEGETANFISLYAPNGFGKTSFYDAVEWGMTNKIGRLLFKKDNKDLADSQYEENKLSIIRNNYAEFDTYVDITDDKGETHSQKLIVNNRRKFDIEFNNKEVHSFHKVVLSQEWISAFLKEDDGQLRYEKFIKNPELIELDAYYKNLIGLINVVSKDKIGQLTVQIGKLKDQITETEESDLLDKINDSIVALGSFDEKLEQIKVSTTKEEIIAFRNLLAPRNVGLEEELIKNKELLDCYKIARNGNENTLGLDLYYSKKEELISLSVTLKEKKINLQKFKTLNELVNQKSGLSAKREIATKKKEDFAKISDAFREYQNIVKQIREKSQRKIEIENKLGIKYEKIRLYEGSRISYEHKIRSLNSEISKINERLKDLPNLKNDLLKSNKGIVDCEKLLKPLEVELKDKEAVKKKDERAKKLYNNIIENIRDFNYDLIDAKHFIDTDLEETCFDKIELIKNDLIILGELKKKQEEITKQVDQHKKLSSNISDFVTEGLNIAKRIKKTSCPLCNQKHDTYEDLIKNISSNQLLDEILQKLLMDQKSIDDSIDEYRKEIKKSNKELIAVYNSRIREINEKWNKSNIIELVSKIEEFKAKLNDFEKTKLELKDKLGGLEPEKLQENLNEQINRLESNKQQVQYFDSKNNYLLDKRKEQVELIASQINQLKKDVDELQLSEQYLMIMDWFKSNNPEIKITRENLDELISDNTALISTYSVEINTLATNIERLQKELNSYKKEDLEVKKSQHEELIEKETIKINSYQLFMKELIGRSISETSKEDLSKFLSEKDNELVEIGVKLNSIKSEYAKLEKFMEIVEPYLQSEQTKIKLSKKEKELNIWENKVAPELNKEREKVKNHLETKIKSFFHTDLINEIYKRIDPHPDFKNVEFKADFGSDNPRLDVFVTDEKQDRTLIPNLYFSSAQINILSLSIFLASALNAKEYDCILIDDPIQSMDSINVLSTIDLFRSIIVNQDKQIILSTHDENFHNLLKKKIPRELFKSKFLELESFGKVKSQLN